jgi:hypothetical protein
MNIYCLDSEYVVIRRWCVDTEVVSDMIRSVMFQNFLRNMNSDVYNMCFGVYNKDRWILFLQYIYGVTQKGVY